MISKIGMLLLIANLLFSCSKESSDDQNTKIQPIPKVQPTQTIQNFNEEEMAQAFEKQEPAFKEKVIGLIFSTLNQETLIKIIKEMKPDEIKKLVSNPEVQRIFGSTQFSSNATQFADVLAKLPADEIEELSKLPQVQALIINVFKEPTVKTQILSSMSQTEIANTLQIPSVQDVMEKEIDKVIAKNNQLATNVINLGTKIFGDLKIKYKRVIGVSNKLLPKTSDLFLKLAVDVKYAKYNCAQIADADVYWKELIAFTSNKRNLLGLESNFFEQMIKSCLTYRRLKGSMEKCQSPYQEEVEALCKSNL